jgi:hypothetical protein
MFKFVIEINFRVETATHELHLADEIKADQ